MRLVVSSFSSIQAKGQGDATAKKQHRKFQNRLNQRARRLRIKEQDPDSVQRPRPFQVRRWRVDEAENRLSSTSSTSKGATATSIHRPAPHTDIDTGTSAFTPKHAAPPSIIFPLSTDHLLHLVQYNVFRAFVSNKRTINTLLTGWDDSPPSRAICPIGAPYYRDDTVVYPLNPNIPLALIPTQLQQTQLHSSWINLIPFPGVRDNLIRHEGSFDHWDLLQDLIGEIMGVRLARQQRSSAVAVSEPETIRILPLIEELDEDEATAGRRGLIVWGEPYDMRSWEITPGFLRKWSWAVEGCEDIVESSNRWRLMRGEEPMRIMPTPCASNNDNK
ncbi:hypothetical protein Cob_v011072 [Colletotrichum orbiculare MAFF 240422]|uniref:BZIP domain-containing protein n=1 Tax=Colletotrichum orbiculare (strain 104-T / ATCC 96160 / CBS 514.97 / LARS 414 / MAFF 240422) TaxID=1213857 RepID=A0A484FEP5_COLOR|nr:hypothetical protein Cob_v011072 [Colletotrichum orbiculare MAFF 240422]